VAIVTVFLLVLVMMLIRAVIAFLLRRIGITGVTLLIGATSWLALKYRNISMSFIWNIFYRACN
jgi:hypothetical protein